MKQEVCIVGLGYIGLPTAALLASRGYTVRGVDVNPSTVEKINRGEVPIVEPGLETFLQAGVRSGKLSASLQPEPADVYILAVPTPFQGDHKPDLSYVEAAARSIAPVVAPGSLVILESTSPVGTTESVRDWILDSRPDLTPDNLQVAHCPERVLPGHIMRELVENDRIVGGVNQASTRAAAEFYRAFVQGEVLETDARTAELAKLTENSFRDVNIAFANELSLICDKLHIDVWDLIRLANRHPRVNILQPGPGVGGHCIAVDPWFIVDSAPAEARLIRTAREVNDAKPEYVRGTIEEVLQGTARPVVALLGLAFKADIDDLRESPAMRIATDLATSHPDWTLLAVEPHIHELPAALNQQNVQLSDLDAAIYKADMIVLLVKHRAFGHLSLDYLGNRPILDTCGMLAGAAKTL